MLKLILNGEQVKNLITRMGLADKESWKKLLETDGEVELTQEQNAELMAQMISVSDAANNPEVEKLLKAKIFQPTEDRLKETLKANGFDEAAIKGLLDGKQNADKITAAMDALKAKIGTGKGTDEERENTWKATKKELETAANEWKTKYESEAAARESDRTDFAFTSFLSNTENFKLRPDMPIATQVKIAKLELEAKAAELGARIVPDGPNSIKLVYKDDTTKPFHMPGEAAPYDVKAGFTSVLDTAGLLNKQPGETRKEEVYSPDPAGATAGQANDAFAANHAALMASMQQQ